MKGKIMQRFICAIFIILFPLLTFAQEPVRILGLMINPSKNSTKITFILTAKVNAKAKTITNPDRVIIDFENTKKSFAIGNAKLGKANVSAISADELPNRPLRFTFWVKGKVTWKMDYVPSPNYVRLQIEIDSELPEEPAKTSMSKYFSHQLLAQDILTKVNSLAEKKSQSSLS